MLDHVTIGVSDLERSKAFYDKALKAIGIERLYSEGAEFFGYGAHKKAFFWIGLKPSAITGVHVAFAVPDRAAVDRFYAAAVGAGGRDNGKPGLRPNYPSCVIGQSATELGERHILQAFDSSVV